MKKILIMMISLTLSLGASAQRKGFHSSRTHVYIVPSISYGFGFGYPYFNYPYLGYPYFGYGYPSYNSRPIPYRLDREIQSIKMDYKYKIKAARKNKSISRAQRKQQILALKSDREKDISNTEINFHPQRMNNMQGMNNRNQQNNQQQGTNGQIQGTGNHE
ncbi:MAG: hypothetical protein ABI237_09295 [Ginsengibacter sp.]